MFDEEAQALVGRHFEQHVEIVGQFGDEPDFHACGRLHRCPGQGQQFGRVKTQQQIEGLAAEFKRFFAFRRAIPLHILCGEKREGRFARGFGIADEPEQAYFFTFFFKIFGKIKEFPAVSFLICVEQQTNGSGAVEGVNTAAATFFRYRAA